MAGTLRAELQLAGRSILSRQIDLAIDLGCERIICLCETTGSEVIARQREVEKAGLQFHAINSHLNLSGLVRADDELLVLLDGIFIDPVVVRALVCDGTALRHVIAFASADHPICSAYPDDFERIDRERNWAGLAIITGETTVGLAEMPSDVDAMSALARLALQTRVECRKVADEDIDNDRWLLACDSETLGRVSAVMIDEALPIPALTGPGNAFAHLFVRSFGPALIGSGLALATGGAAFLLVIAAVLAFLEYSTLALFIAALGTLTASLRTAFGVLRGRLGPLRPNSIFQGLIERTFVDLLLLLIATAVLTFSLADTAEPWVTSAIPTLAMGLAWLAGKSGSHQLRAFWNDRAMHFIVFSVASAFGLLEGFVILFALGALLYLMLIAQKH